MVEVVLALVVAGVVAAAAFRAYLVAQRAYREQVERAWGNAALREAAVVLRAELAELDGTDSLGGDILALSAASMRYRAYRGFAVLCQPPDAAGLAVAVWGNDMGLREIDAEIDSVLLLAHGDAVAQSDNRWRAADVVAVERGPVCPGGRLGARIALGGISASELAAVHDGAPARIFEISEINRYRDGGGRWWMGMRRYQKVEGFWPPIQPVVGPLAPGGLEFRGYDAAGAGTEDTDRVTGIGATVLVAGETARRTTRSLEVRVALRGTPRW